MVACTIQALSGRQTSAGPCCLSARWRPIAEDHVHIVCLLWRNHALKKIIEEVKKATSKWIKTKGPRYRSFYWQTGYAAHSVSPTQLEAVDRYVANQEAHHTRMTFQEELRIICRKNGIELDEWFAWD